MNAHAIDITYPLIVDSFAGGGGASTGIEDALAELIAEGILPQDHPDHVTLAINHDDAALAMHAANHPRTIHLPHNVWKVSLAEIVAARRIGLVWMSPDCRHHSKAKGGAPVSPSVRDLAWVAMRWLKELRPEQRPRKIFLENVEEFRKWGPLDADGRPDRAREGETFNAWVRELKKLGYRRVEWRELRACDFGVPTIRKRLYLVASMDGEIVWPEPTHGDPRSEAVREGRLLPWRTAASDVIDWSLPCPSIFMTKAEAKAYRLATGKAVIRPLAPKTHARIAKGVKRYVLDPMLTVPTKGRFGLVEADAVAPEHPDLGVPLSSPMIDRARQVAAFLREHECWDEREFVTVEIDGVLFVVVDIGMRMLTARELARAQGFRDDYVLAAPFKGGTLTDTDQRHKIGNSVCPPMARALIRSNYRLPAGTKARPASPTPLFLEAAE